MKRVRLRALITPDHVRYILYAPMAILLPVALTAIFMISLLSCVMPLVKILLTLRHVCVGHQEGSRAKLLTMCNVSSILTLHQEHGDRSSIGRALDCGSSGCGFKPHRSPFIFLQAQQLLEHTLIDRPNWQVQVELLKLDRLARGKTFLLPTRRSPVHIDILLILAH